MTDWTSPKTWGVGELVTKAMLDTHLRDNTLYLKEQSDLRPLMSDFVTKSHSNTTGYSYSTNAWRDMPNSNADIVLARQSTILVYGVVVAYGSGTFGFRNFKFNINGTDINAHVSVETYAIGENQSTPVIGILTGVAAGNVTIKLREICGAAGYTCDSKHWIAVAIPEA